MPWWLFDILDAFNSFAFELSGVYSRLPTSLVGTSQHRQHRNRLPQLRCVAHPTLVWQARHSKVRNRNSSGKLRQDPLDLSFWSFLTFLHHGIEKVETHLLWKFHKTIQRKSWSNVPPTVLTCIGFLYKVVHKNGRLRKFNGAGRFNLTFLPLGLSLWNLAHLFIMFISTKLCLRFFNFCPGT